MKLSFTFNFKMFRSLIFIAALLTVGLSAPNEVKSGRIVGGVIPNAERFPHVVSLTSVTTGQHFCGGAIIAEQWVITSAQCTIERTPAIVYIVAGSVSNSAGIRFTVMQIINHPLYDAATFTNDISLVATVDILSGPNIASRPLAWNDSFFVDGLPVFLAGWGHENYPDGSNTENLKYIVQSTITNGVCSSLHAQNADLITETNVCTLSNSESEGACYGDNGGPLTLYSSDVSQQYILGVFSWSVPCAVGVPEVFTRVASYLDWIEYYTDVSK